MAQRGRSSLRCAKRGAVGLFCGALVLGSPANASNCGATNFKTLTANTVIPYCNAGQPEQNQNCTYSGYIAKDTSGGLTFTPGGCCQAAQFSLIVPNLFKTHSPILPATCPGLGALQHMAGAWVGYGGIVTQNLAQAGIGLEFECAQTLGQQFIIPHYTAWYQWINGTYSIGPITVPLPVNPGDAFVAHIQPSTSTGTRGVDFFLSTNGIEGYNSFSKLITNGQAPDGTTAEWIVEHTVLSNVITHEIIPTFMSEYGNLTMTAASASVTQNVSANNCIGYAIGMVLPGEVYWTEAGGNCAKFVPGIYSMFRVLATNANKQPLSYADVETDPSGCPDDLHFTYCGPGSGQSCH